MSNILEKIEERYMVISYSDNDFWRCADSIMENISGFINCKNYWDKDDLISYCKSAFDVFVKIQTLNNKILRRFSEPKMSKEEIKKIVEKKEYYEDVRVSFFHSRADFPKHWDNCEHYYIDLETGKYASL